MLSKKLHFKEAVKVYKETKSSDKTAKILCDKYNFNFTPTEGRKIRKWLNKANLTPTKRIEDSEIFVNAKKNKINTKSKYYIITSAQNATKLNLKLWENIKAYQKHLKAELCVIPIRYRNPTSVFKDLPHDYWDNRIHKYLVANRYNIHKNLTVVGDLKVQPTAVTPLSGLEGLTKEESCVIGHPRQHFKVIPTLDQQPEKFMLSTGSITMENYTDSKSGKKGEFHHVYGFAIVEIKDEETFFVRQISANKNGSFYDLDTHVKNGKVKTNQNCVKGVVFGDVHLGNHSKYALREAMKMLIRFNPNNVVLHDIMDGYSISHHEKRDPFIALNREIDGSWDLEREIYDVISFLNTIKSYKPIIVRSNHDDFVDRWLLDTDWRSEKNKYAYLKYSKLKADGLLPKGILPYNIDKEIGNSVTCLGEDDSFKICGVEVGVHGHIGSGGSRGSSNQFKRLNTKLVTGHTHSPLKEDNLTTVGTLTKLRMGYNKGLSNWFHSNVIIHPNGKTQIILIHEEKGWTTL